ncbi:MAG: transcriptional regulator [Gammaproteobacteria bacterium]|nr:transcriptional regulator [Gammaproteobacteria bacterium]
MSVSNPFRLGVWVVRPGSSSLEQSDRVVRIEPRYMDLLTYLAERSGEVVSASDILDHVWSGMVVGDHSVYQGIARLRKVLGDRSDNPLFIETVPKRGYRLLMPPSLERRTVERNGRVHFGRGIHPATPNDPMVPRRPAADGHSPFHPVPLLE